MTVPAIAGCGGSSSNGSLPVNGATSAAAPAATATSAPTFVPEAAAPPSHPVGASRLKAQASAICTRVNEQIGAATGLLNAREIARTSLRNAGLEFQAVAALARLTPPSSLARDWRQMIAYRRTLASELLALGHAGQTNNAASIRALALSKRSVHQKLSALASRDGIAECGATSARRGRSPAQRSLPLAPGAGADRKS